MALAGSLNVESIETLLPRALMVCCRLSGGGTVAVLLAFLSSTHLPSKLLGPPTEAAATMAKVIKVVRKTRLYTNTLLAVGRRIAASYFKKSGPWERLNDGPFDGARLQPD